MSLPQNRRLAIGRTAMPVVLASLLLTLAPICPADEIVLTNGRTYKGLVLERTETYVLFKAVMGSGTAEIQLPLRNIASVKIDGKMPAPEPAAPEAERPKAPADPSPATRPAGGAPAPASDPLPRPPSRSEIEALIDKAGKTPPEWWDSVALDYPKTLDLTGRANVPGGDPNQSLSAYFPQVVRPNPARWRPAVKLYHEAIKVRKDDPQKLGEAMLSLAHLYHVYLRDWARGAFWYRHAMARIKFRTWDITHLAECYFVLGSKAMAVELLTQNGLDRIGDPWTVRLWGEMGELDRAAAGANAMVQRGRPEMGYMALATVYRRAGKLDQAAELFQKVIDLKTGGKGLQEQQKYAQQALEGLRLIEKLDLSRVPDGSYTGSCQAYRGPIEMKVTIAAGKIEKVETVRHTEDIFYSAFETIPASIVEGQGFKKVDAITDATATSEAIINAAVKALVEGMK